MKVKLRLSENGLNFIKSFEDFYPVVTLLPSGKVVIGYGHTGKDVRAPDLGMRTISPETATELLKKDLESVENLLNAVLKKPLKQDQFDALCDYLFTIGTAHFHKSSLLKSLNAGNFAQAAAQILVEGKQDALLKQRRRAEHALFTGQGYDLRQHR